MIGTLREADVVDPSRLDPDADLGSKYLLITEVQGPKGDTYGSGISLIVTGPWCVPNTVADRST